MANCSCTGSTGSTYATVNRGYGCLSSVPTASSIPYNCFLPPTNMNYYQNFPFYNGPCGTVAGSSSDPGSSGGSSSNCCCCCCPGNGGSSSAPVQPSAPAAPNCCCCCCPTNGSSSGTTTQPSAPAAPNCCCCCCPAQPGSSGGSGSVPSTPLMPAIPTGKCCFPWYFPWCCPTTSEEEEEEEDEDMSSTNPCCCFPWFCNPCCGAPQSVPSTPLMPPACCKPCKPNPCCQPAALIATSNGTFQPTANGLVPLTLVNTLSSALSLMGDTITINCPGTYLVTLSSNIPGTSNYVGNASVALNGSPIATTTQTFANATASQNTTQAIVKATKGSTLTITTSAAGTAQITPTGGTNLFTISVVRIA